MKRLSFSISVLFCLAILASACFPFTGVGNVLDRVSDELVTQAAEVVEEYEPYVPAPEEDLDIYSGPTEVDTAMFCRDVDDEECIGETDTFGVYDKIWFYFHFRNFPEDTEWRAEWFYGTGESIYTYEIKAGGTRTMWFYIYPNTSWKRGDAYLNLYSDDILYATYDFDIQ